MPDFSKIWATNSPLPTYTFTDADYLDGWDFIAAAPPTKNQFDAWFRATDEKLKWLYDKLNDTANAIYPVGAVYISFNSTSPSSLFGGTWQRLKDTFLLANGDSYAANTTGGSATKSISVNNLPAHNHSVNSAGAHTHTATTANNGAHNHTASSASAGAHTHTASSGSAGSHTHTRGTMNITGSIVARDLEEIMFATDDYTESGALRVSNYKSSYGWVDAKQSGAGYQGLSFDASRSGAWTGATSSAGAHTHTITVNSGGAHTHNITVNSNGTHNHSVTVNSNGAHTHTTNNTGGSQPLNILPPYTTVYMWKRTA